MTFKITQLSTSRCPPCQAAKSYLSTLAEDDRFEYEYVDLHTPEGMARMKELGKSVRGVPMFFLDEEHIEMDWMDVVEIVKNRLGT
jgi:glutaredoxin